MRTPLRVLLRREEGPIPVSEATKTRRCKRGHVKVGRYCKACKANNERKRYWQNPDRERSRKRSEYNREHTPPMKLRPTQIVGMYGERMTTTATACEHPNAVQLDEFPGIFYCTDEDTFFDLNGETVPNPYEAATDTGGAQQGKAVAPATTGAPKNPSAPGVPKKTLPQGMKRAYHRDPSLMETVKCSHPGCKATFPMWPQNIKDKNYCPDLHRPQVRLAQAAERQKRFRERTRQA